MSYRADKQVIDTHTHTDRHTDRGDDNTRRPKLASGKNDNIIATFILIQHIYVTSLEALNASQHDLTYREKNYKS